MAGLVALGTAAVYSVKKSMDLQKALAEVQAVTKANTTQMAAYKSKAIEVGTATGVDLGEAGGRQRGPYGEDRSGRFA